MLLDATRAWLQGARVWLQAPSLMPPSASGAGQGSHAITVPASHLSFELSTRRDAMATTDSATGAAAAAPSVYHPVFTARAGTPAGWTLQAHGPDALDNDALLRMGNRRGERRGQQQRAA